MADHDTHDHTGIPGVGGTSDLDTILAASSGQDIADALTGAAAPDAGNVFATMADVGGGSPALVWLGRQTATNSSPNMDFAGLISATYETYKFEFNNILPATNGATFQMQMGTGGGPTYDTGANYGWRAVRNNTGASGPNGTDSGTTAITLVNAILQATSHNTNGSLTLHNPGGSTFKYAIGQFTGPDTATSSTVLIHVSGNYLITTAVTAVRFFMSSGNVTSGTIDMYGVTKA